LQKKNFTHKIFYIKKLFTRKRFCTQKLWHKIFLGFAHISISTQDLFCKEFFYTEFFMYKKFFTRKHF
jgi:hypothetical protein